MAKIKPTPRGMSLKERLAIRSKPGPNGCIDFVGYIDPHGRGRISIAGQKGALASRVSYEAHKGPLPLGKQALHTCDRPICINPDHLYPGTDAENALDKALRERCNKSRITSADVIRIRQDTRLQHVIAAEYGVSQVAISMIKLRKNWKFVP